MEQQALLEKRLSISQREYFQKPTTAKLKEITAIRSTLDSWLTKKAGEKLDRRYLANLTKKRRSSQNIESILDELF